MAPEEAQTEDNVVEIKDQSEDNYDVAVATFRFLARHGQDDHVRLRAAEILLTS